MGSFAIGAMHLKRTMQRGFDAFQYWWDVFPNRAYQPLPWIGLHHARRGGGTLERWRAIRHELMADSVRSALDVGCQVGFFCFAMAELGIAALGVDCDARALRIATFAADKVANSKVAFCNMLVARDTVGLLPRVDAVLMMSVWHHWYRQHGLKHASELLSEVWGRADKMMFFDTGEDEMPDEYRPPEMTGRAQEWLTTFLKTTCAGGAVKHMGKFQAFAPDGDEDRHVAWRNLFVVRRT